MDFVIDDCRFVIALTEFFRDRFRIYETDTLLPLARDVAKRLGIRPLDVPVEGYYAETEELSEYFRLVRGFQQEKIERCSVPQSLRELRAVFLSGFMGRVCSEDNQSLLPRLSNALNAALERVSRWNVVTVTRSSKESVLREDEDLIAVAAATGHPVPLCNARETMVLATALISEQEDDYPKTIWRVSSQVESLGAAFVRKLAAVTDIRLPEPQAAFASVYASRLQSLSLDGRCVCLGFQYSTERGFYHWYIDESTEQSSVIDFWSTSIWTTSDLAQLPWDKRPQSGTRIGAPVEEANQPDDL
jgi:hypothetical protein